MYHQFDRSMHPRQSILNTILTLKEKSQKAQSMLQALENVSYIDSFSFSSPQFAT